MMTTGDSNHKEEPMDTDDKKAAGELNGDSSIEDMEDMDDEYKSEATFRFEVKNFSKVKESQLSPPCYVRGLPWKIMIMPRDHAKNRSLGYFLQCNADSDIPNWSCTAHAVLRLISQKEGVVNYERKINHLFYPKENDWGYSCFMMWDQVADPDKGYIKDDTVIFEVFVNADAPHGVQWDSKKHTGHVGLKNQGATCYMNSLLQTLFFTNKLRKAVYQMPTQGDDPTKSVALAMQRVFYELQFSDKPVGTKKLTRSFGWDTFDSFLQHDVQELCRVLLDNLESKMKGTNVEGTIPKLFEGKMKSFIRCKNVSFESKREEPFYDIQLNVKGNRTIHDSFRDYVNTESLDGDNKYDAGDYGLQDAEKGIKFLKFPPVLHLQLMRFQYDPMMDQNVKINDRFEFPEKLVLDDFLESPESTPAKYTLHAVLVHSGDFHGGHYVVFINCRGTGRWCKFDDDVVSRCTKAEAIDANYGGDDDLPHRHCTNAYMLVYIRDSILPEVLQPVSEKDISKPLQQRLEEERSQEAAKKQEKSEAHLYVTVQLILEDYFEGHQTFDLIDFELSDKLFRKFKLKKTQTYGDLVNLISNSFRLAPNQFRFWPFIHRKNGTIRPCYLEYTAEDLKIEELAQQDTPWNVFLETIQVGRGEPVLPHIDHKREILIFLKFYDYKNATISYCGHCLLSLSKSLRDLMPDLCKRANLPLNTNLLLFEEVSHNKVEPLIRIEEPFEMVCEEPMDGDILVFQVQPVDNVCQFPTADTYFRELYNRIDMDLVDRGADPQQSVTQMSINMRWSYEQLAKALALRINHDPYKIQFFKNSPYRDTPGIPIRYMPDTTIKDMLDIRNKQRGYRYKLFYQKVPFRVDDMENRRTLKVTWMDSKFKTEELTVYPERAGSVKGIFEEVVKMVTMPDNGTGRLRLLEINTSKIVKLVPPETSVEELMPTQRTLRVEEIPQDQLTIDSKSEYLLPVAHFQKENYHTFGTPFYIKIRNGEPFSSVKSRIQKMLEIPDKEFEKYKFALITGGKQTYFDNENLTISLHDLLTGQPPIGVVKPWLGLDHINKGTRRSAGHPAEKAIVIHN